MILKEYRIYLPLTVDEYRIAQLYMIAVGRNCLRRPLQQATSPVQKKSRTDSTGAGSGVEIIKNEPYVNGPNGTNGQYTYKIYHVGNHLPSELCDAESQY